MRARQLFLFSLTAFVLVHLCYGLNRLSLGIDFTDEGAYLSWPLRMLFGEAPFVSELATLLRPLASYLFVLFKLHPATTLYEFRLLGWCVHLLAFLILAIYLFRLSGAPLQSPLIASVPFFVCHIFGLASPSYNSLSSDFLLIALSLRGLAAIAGTKWKVRMNIASGLALFICTLAHPGLGVVGAVILARELLKQKLAQNLIHRRMSPSNIGVLVFTTCWLAFFLYLAATGAVAVWLERTILFQSLAVNPMLIDQLRTWARLAGYPFLHSRIALVFSVAALVCIGAWLRLSRRGDDQGTARAATILGFLLVAALVCTFSYEPDQLPVMFAQISFVLVATSLARSDRENRFLVLMSALGAVLYATATFYFSSLRCDHGPREFSRYLSRSPPG
jgi:hypothetical protein